jgi:hypothetical protein
MKRTIPFLALAMAFGSNAQAQWTTDLATNTYMRAASSGDVNTPLVADGPDGSTYSCWFENGTGEYQLRMQRLDASGNRMWDDAGLIVSDHPQNSAIFRYDMKSDADGNAVVAFQDERTGSLDIVAYKIGPDGSFLWGADGIELPTPGTTGLAPVVVPLSNGNTAIAWNTDNSPGQVAVQLVGPTGTLLLTVPFQISAATAVGRPKLIATSDGGFILQYVVSNGGFGLPPGMMYAQRYDAEGDAVWANALQVSSKIIAFFFFPEPIPDGHDGFYLAYNTGNPDNASFTDVYVQHVRGNGTLWSTDGTRADNSSTTQKFKLGHGLAVVNDDDGLMVPMQVTDGAQGQSGFSVQRLDTAGTRQLGDAAVTVIPVTSTYVQPTDISATGDGAVITHYSGGFGQVHIAATRVDLSGATVWAPAQMDICTANSNKDDVQMTDMRDGQIVVVWDDDRTPGGIYAQNIAGLDPTTGVQAIASANGLLRLEQNPASSPVLLVDQSFGAGADLQVFDIQGRSVYSGRLASTGPVELPLGSLNEGLYTLRLTGNGQVGTVRWVK